ncbi:MAG TPA: signal peptidase I [Gaiellaceae bacterium]|nr:signal peptidase I [Gaiellaceae bacterium]
MHSPNVAAGSAAAPTAVVVESPPRRRSLRIATGVATYGALAVLTVVVLGLLAITVGPKLFPYQALVVRSGSMAPTIPTGSIVFYRKVAAKDVKVGDVIVFSHPDDPSERVTHRVYRIGSSATGRYFVTKGDANGAPDDWRVPAVGTGWKEAVHAPGVGYVLYGLQSPLGRLLLLVIPAVLLALITIGELVGDRRKPVPE